MPFSRKFSILSHSSLITLLLASGVTLFLLTGVKTQDAPTKNPDRGNETSVTKNGDFSCLVCTSNSRLEAKNPKDANSSFYQPDCLNPTSDLLNISPDNDRVVKCADFPSRMQKHLEVFRQDRDIATASGGEKIGCSAIFGGYNVCGSMYYEANLNYYKLEDPNKYEPSFTGKNELVVRMCACVDKKMLEDVKKHKKVCTDTKRGRIRRRICYCDPTHPDYGTKACNSAERRHPFFWTLVVFMAVLLPVSKYVT